ncbi:MAG: hypothetical protein HY554_02975 [Elusimicrobia bacterium]|nr:hypothetical protein [Elusimicrobiota bacterium]
MRGAFAACLLALLAAPALAAKAPARARLPDDRQVSQLLERAAKAAAAKDRKGFLACLTVASRTLFERVFAGDSWQPAGLAGRAGLRLLELRRHASRPWALAVVPGKEGAGQDALFLRREDGHWRLDEQHALLLWQTVQEIVRSKQGQRREERSLAAPNLIGKQARSSGLPEGWSAEDPFAEGDWSNLPKVEEAFIQKLKGPRDRRVNAKFVLFAEAEDADWELWRRKMEMALRSELPERQPEVGEAAAFGRHSNTSFELLVRKGRSLVILYGDSEDVVGIGHRIAEQL